MHLVIKPKEEMLQNALAHVNACRQGGIGDALLLKPYVAEGYFTLDELGITQEELDTWHTEAMKYDYDD